MNQMISAIERTRETTAKILSSALVDVQGKTEQEIRDRILEEMTRHEDLFPRGWYDPPPGGVAILSARSPFERLQFETLRHEKYWPRKEFVFDEESVSMIYLSPVDRTTGMFGDIGLTMYTGNNPVIREHIRQCHDVLIQAAELTQVGMTFSGLYHASIVLFENEGQKVIGWMTTFHDPLKINLGHIVPGSYGDGIIPLETFEETREAIRSRRMYINESEAFKIPETCAFTFEARLTDAAKELPNTFFHIIVVFDSGQRRILTNFEDIFRTVGMEYML